MKSASGTSCIFRSARQIYAQGLRSTGPPAYCPYAFSDIFTSQINDIPDIEDEIFHTFDLLVKKPAEETDVSAVLFEIAVMARDGRFRTDRFHVFHGLALVEISESAVYRNEQKIDVLVFEIRYLFRAERRVSAEQDLFPVKFNEKSDGVRGELSVALRRALMAKNAAGVRALLRDTAAPDRVRKAWETLAELYAPAERAVLELYELCLSDDMEKAAGELGELSRRAEVNVDFSVISDGRYYNGIVFKGYLPGVPSAVLSGGRYDGLAKRLGKDCGAVGFAVYTEYLNGRESL